MSMTQIIVFFKEKACVSSFSTSEQCLKPYLLMHLVAGCYLTSMSERLVFSNTVHTTRKGQIDQHITNVLLAGFTKSLPGL